MSNPKATPEPGPDGPEATGNQSVSESPNSDASSAVSIRAFQKLIRGMYHEKDVARGISGTFMWLMEEIGELSTALRDFEGDANDENKKDELAMEFADVLAWLATIANVAEIDLDAAITRKYGAGCPGCDEFVCTCPDEEKP